MEEWKISKLYLKIDLYNNCDFKTSIEDLLENSTVDSMKKFKHHCNISCLEHSLYVSYVSYLVCKFLGLDYHSAARGGLLHDMFLYDWHTTSPYSGKHAFIHPSIALENACGIFFLNQIEKDIIKNHMWPLTVKLPKYKEAIIVCLVDKYCAFIEIVNFYKYTVLNRFIHLIGLG